MLGRLLRGERDGGDAEDPGDLLGDAAQGDVLGGAVQRLAGRGLLQRQPEEGGGVEAVDRGPAVSAVADVGRGAVLARGRGRWA
jgi:hypothetical protein